MKMQGNFEKAGIVNPSVPVKTKPIYAPLYVPKDGRLTLFNRRVKIVKRGFGHRYWNYKGKDVCPVHKQDGRWVISTKDIG